MKTTGQPRQPEKLSKSDRSDIIKAPPLAFVLFGATGDLSHRKILPALANLAATGNLSNNFCLIGVALDAMGDEEFREMIIKTTSQTTSNSEWENIVAQSRYIAGKYEDPDTFERLEHILNEVDLKLGTAGNRLYYLATIPSMFGTLAKTLAKHKLNSSPNQDGSHAVSGNGFCRIVVEKPYGHDLESAKKLDAMIHEAFHEDQIYRIDHYLGKETVQNVLALRFANAIFEPIWNRRYVNHVQVTVAESIGVEHRGAFYEQAGAVRDIVQNHVMQVLALTLMEPPAVADPQSIRDEKVKLLKTLQILKPDEVKTSVVRGQYTQGQIDGNIVPAYRAEPGVNPLSTTETYVALRLFVNNWRWEGVPVYIRTGKRLPKRVTEVAVQFHQVPHLSFAGKLARELDPDAMIIRIQPDEGVCMCFGAKVPGESFKLKTVSMDFSYGKTFAQPNRDAYERLLLDAMIGDPTLFIRADEVDRAWQVVDPLLEAFADNTPPLSTYEAGSWGPVEADHLISKSGQGHAWRLP
ncbi:MAG: glucose-6-phosphate dehydrogenase [Actinobacteria bacterium]|nr:glucose-6-phosphate dehydrogenase [Actinomycetota bacterium]MCL6105727.1 glucose-6-phosphate dehydrogenase [Actinomycetota bacterium]